MIDLDWKAKMVIDMEKSPKFSDKSQRCVQSSYSEDTSTALDYEEYLRLPELAKLWSSEEFPQWKNERLVKPALQALEISFRLLSVVLLDRRSYANTKQWKRRLENLACHQIEIIATFCEEESEERCGNVPIRDLDSSIGVLARRDRSSSEVWQVPGSTPVVNKTSEQSLLPLLATWQKSEDVATKILFSIECHLQRSPFTLGLGEPNLAGKPNLEYDLICKPFDLHLLKKSPYEEIGNSENEILFNVHQILESWIVAAKELIKKIEAKIEEDEYDKAASYCWLVEKIWKLLIEIEDLHLLMDPDDFLRLKNQLSIKSPSDFEPFCFRSKNLQEFTRYSKELKQYVPKILAVEVDPHGGPRIQESAMKLFHVRRGNNAAEKIHLLQAFQAIESALKKFFFSYRQLIVTVMGSLEANSARSLMAAESCDELTEIFLEPPYFPSLDAAKTFLGDMWRRNWQTNSRKFELHKSKGALD